MKSTRSIAYTLAFLALTFAGSVLTVPAVAQTAVDSSRATSANRVFVGNDRVTAEPKMLPPVPGGESSFKFEDTPLADVVQVLLREILKADYVVHPPINGSVTLATQGNISPDQAMFILEGALQVNGLVMARDPRGVFHIGKPDIVRSVVPGVRQFKAGQPLPPGYGAIVVPLAHIGASEMAAILRPMLPAEAIARVDAVRNLLILVGTRAQAEGWLDLVATFDVNLLKGMSAGVFALKYISTREVEAALRLLSAGTGAPGAPAPAAPAPAPSAPTGAPAGPLSTQPTRPLEAFSAGAFRVIPIERLNSVLVVSSRASHIEQAKEWIEKLDKPGATSSEPQLFVYAVQNGSAAHLARVLGGLFGGGQATPGTTTGVAPGLQQATGLSNPLGAAPGTSLGVGGGFGNTGLAAANALSGAGRSVVQGTGVTPVFVNAATGLRVVADELNNSVLVFGTALEYEKIEAALKRLDVPPTQVLIEASIVEVTLNDDLRYGLQWMFTDPRGSNTGTGVLSSIAGAAIGQPAAGFSYTLRNSAGNVRAVLEALANKSLVKVISSPSLMVLDNHTANIVVGNQQPVRVGETITVGGNITNNIQYKDTGVTLAVTPSVNSGNMVTMQLNQAVTDVGQVDTATGQRAFLQRQIGSKVAVRSGETLVLGGLIRDNATAGKAGLPLLQDIPLVGKLFGANSVASERTELLVVITPRVVRSDVDIRDLSNEMRSRMRGISASGLEAGGAAPTSAPAR
ncbi:MAG: type II secretion system protein GspD [Betaproteobacteria bacterium]|nr:type II secretion system protein GspD [Betaproteobacteria bacterium]